MAGPYLSANGIHVTDLDLSVPWYGAPVADVALASGATLSNPVTLTVGNLALTMALVRAPATNLPRLRSFAGVTTARLVGGSGTWSTLVSLDPYRAPPGSSGVMLSKVLKDLVTATKAGGTAERVRIAADRSLGPFFVPETNAPAGRVLALLAGPLWWVDFTGLTQIAPTRTPSAIKSSAQVEHADGGRGWITVATEDVAAWATPGATYSSALVPDGLTVAASRIRSDNEGTLRVEVLTL